VTHNILLVEDEPSLVLTLTDRLEAEGYSVESVGDGENALERLGQASFELVLLDVNLPGRNGFEVCKEMRKRRLQMPVLMLTARRQVADKVVGLETGADDYLTKPFEMIELLARIKALLRRAGSPMVDAPDGYAFGDVQVDFAANEVTKGGEPVQLSALDFKLLHHFIVNRGKTVTREQLLDEVWGYDAMLYTRTVDVHVAGLRQKLEDKPAHPRFILTVHRVGYKFVG